jgi:poly(3-hydroxyalkanoate) depolymerase
MDRDFVSWRGHRVYVRVTGQGDPLLLITGLGGNTDMWTPFAQQFPNRRVIRFDVPGMGLSSQPLTVLPVPAIAALAAAILDDLEVEFADVIGFSYGGAVAQQLAFSYPDRVRRLVLAATSCGLGAVPGSLGAMASLVTPMRYYSSAYFDRTAALSYGGMTGRDLSVRRRMMAERHRHPPSIYGYSMQLLGTLGWSSLPFLSRIPHDTLVLCGDDDPLIPLVNAETLARRIPRAHLEVCPRSGHLFLWDEAKRMAGRVARFLDSHAGAGHFSKRTVVAAPASVPAQAPAPALQPQLI